MESNRIRNIGYKNEHVWKCEFVANFVVKESQNFLNQYIFKSD